MSEGPNYQVEFDTKNDEKESLKKDNDSIIRDQKKSAPEVSTKKNDLKDIDPIIFARAKRNIKFA
ncbi:hypothetical protein K8R66_01755 [bacterium]|nr:hypothetical protein [bacterium]